MFNQETKKYQQEEIRDETTLIIKDFSNNYVNYEFKLEIWGAFSKINYINPANKVEIFKKITEIFVENDSESELEIKLIGYREIFGRKFKINNLNEKITIKRNEIIYDNTFISNLYHRLLCFVWADKRSFKREDLTK